MNTQCPRCKNFKTIGYRVFLVLVAGCFIFIGVLFSFLLFPIVLIPIGFLLAIVSIIAGGKKVYCLECKNIFSK